MNEKQKRFECVFEHHEPALFGAYIKSSHRCFLVFKCKNCGKFLDVALWGKFKNLTQFIKDIKKVFPKSIARVKSGEQSLHQRFSTEPEESLKEFEKIKNVIMRKL